MVAVPRELFRNILSLIDDLLQRLVPVEAEEIDGKVKMTGEVRLDYDIAGQMSFRIRLSH